MGVVGRSVACRCGGELWEEVRASRGDGRGSGREIAVWGAVSARARRRVREMRSARKREEEKREERQGMGGRAGGRAGEPVRAGELRALAGRRWGCVAR